MLFEWDETKNRRNQKRHGLSFENARAVFSDPLAVFQPNHGSHIEDRWQIIGKVDEMTIAVVIYVVRGDDVDVYRLISARRVTAHERRKYEEG